MSYQRKTKDIWKLYVKYNENDGWEHEVTEFSFLKARQVLREYRENCPQYPSKITMSRERVDNE